MGREAVFMHVPKTGGASILQMCMRYRIRVIDHNLWNPDHVSLARYKSINPDIYSFAVVRNPWDRVVSSYHFLKKGGLKKEDSEDAELFVNCYGSFRDFVMNAFRDEAILEQIHFRPQYQWISNDNGIIIDMLGRFEKLQLHYSRWCKSLQLPDNKLPHVNRSDHLSYKTYYSADTIEEIRRVYARDIGLFRYKF